MSLTALFLIMEVKHMSLLATETYDKLLVGGSNYDALTKIGTVLTGQTLVRGSVLGIVTASGKYKLCDASASDGSEVPKFILVNDTDASAADAKATVYKTGVFNRQSLTWGTNGAPTGYETALHDIGIFLKDET